MRILHTSDWHLGQNFMGKSREEEHCSFLSWLRKTIEEEAVDVLIVAGDIFDTGTPPNYALELYYNFLKELSLSSCKYIIITAGNHDSIATLKAPKQLLKALNVHVITSGDENEDELIAIYDKEKLQGVVCAVPFLRDYVVRKAQGGQTMQDKEFSLSEGIKEHYNDVFYRAKELSADRKVPIVKRTLEIGIYFRILSLLCDNSPKQSAKIYNASDTRGRIQLTVELLLKNMSFASLKQET